MYFFKGFPLQVQFIKALPSVTQVSFIVTDLHRKACQTTWFLSCLAAAGRGGKLTWRSCLFGWQAVLTVEMHARQHLFQSSVYSKRMLYVKDMSDWTLHLIILGYTQKVVSAKSGSEVCKVKVLSGRSGPLAMSAGGTHLRTLRNCFSLPAFQLQPTPWSYSG